MAIATPAQASKTQESPFLTVKNPVTSEHIGKIPVQTAEEVRQAVNRARQAQPAWEALGVKGRAKLLRAWGDLLWSRQQELIAIIRRETGKPDGGALLEAIGTDNVINYYYHNAPKFLKPESRQSLFPYIHRAKVHYKARGVVGIISPWNYPFFLPFMDLLPALFAGNTVVIKPSEITPYSVEFGVKLMHEVGIPQGVIQAVYGDGRTGSALVDYVDFVAFTGSTATGRKVAMRCAERLIPCTMELGGKDPSIVLNDANLDLTATGLLRGAFENAGQVCISVERVYVESGIYEPLIARMLHYAKQFNVGHGDGLNVHMGSMTNLRELERTEAHIADAVQKGARVLWGGKRRPDLGELFFEPTILVDVTHDMDIMREETFGPILPIMRIESHDEAIRLANDTPYGLSASIFSTNLALAEKLALKIDSGDVSINRTQFAVGTPSLPTGGQRESGLGRRNGKEGLMKYVTSQAILIDNQLGQKPDLSLADPLSLKVMLFLRRIRRYITWI